VKFPLTKVAAPDPITGIGGLAAAREFDAAIKAHSAARPNIMLRTGDLHFIAFPPAVSRPQRLVTIRNDDFSQLKKKVKASNREKRRVAA